MTKFYTYFQNNTGGSFKTNDDVREYVIIEANNFEHANEIAQEKGIYFNGCEDGIDCSCCGDRWDEQYDESEGTEKPQIYDESAYNCKETLFRKEGCIIYYLDGRKEIIDFN